MASPMRAAASAKLKKRGWLDNVKDWFKPIGYKPPAQQGAEYQTEATPRGRMMRQEEAQERGTYTSPGPKPKSYEFIYPDIPYEKPKKSETPREIARRRREARGEK